MSNRFKDAIDHLHDNIFVLLRPEFIAFFLSHLNLLILVSFRKQNPKFALKNKPSRILQMAYFKVGEAYLVVIKDFLPVFV